MNKNTKKTMKPVIHPARRLRTGLFILAATAAGLWTIQSFGQSGEEASVNDTKKKGLAALFSKSSKSEGDFVKGALAWANNCTRCHNPRDAKELRDDQWVVVVSHMRVRAGLTGQEARDILKFLQESN